MELITFVGRVEFRFSPFGDGVNVSARGCMVCTEHTIGIETILDALDGTPRRRSSTGSSVRSVWR
jgi:hypothetical protein